MPVARSSVTPFASTDDRAAAQPVHRRVRARRHRRRPARGDHHHVLDDTGRRPRLLDCRQSAGDRRADLRGARARVRAVRLPLPPAACAAPGADHARGAGPRLRRGVSRADAPGPVGSRGATDAAHARLHRLPAHGRGRPHRKRRDLHGARDRPGASALAVAVHGRRAGQGQPRARDRVPGAPAPMAGRRDLRAPRRGGGRGELCRRAGPLARVAGDDYRPRGRHRQQHRAASVFGPCARGLRADGRWRADRPANR